MIRFVCFCEKGIVTEALGAFPGLVRYKVVGYTGPWWNRRPVRKWTRAHVHIEP